MRVFIHVFIALLLCLVPLSAAKAQDDDKGFLTRSIQDALSGSGRTVSIDGFQGALSSSASFDKMTIADGEGIWLTLQDVQLVWSRAALLRGRLEVDSLTAARLDIPRLPIATGPQVPDAEAAPFRLPELPVSVRVSKFAVSQINLGAPILGESAQLSIKASAELTGELADIDLQAERTDAKRGTFAIRANFEREDSILDLLLNLSEGDNGIAARMLNIPDQPSVDLSVQGNGPLDDFTADVKVTTQGQERLAGQVILDTQAPRRASDTPDRRLQADISGDITALLAPRYREFFGTDVQLTVDALLEGTGAVDVSAFALNAKAAMLEGKVSLNAEGWPTLIDVSGRVANPDGTGVLLPLGGEATTIENMFLRVDYDVAAGDAIDAGFDVTGLRQGGIEIGHTRLGLMGTLSAIPGQAGQFQGDLRFAASALQLSDAAMAEAVGREISGKAQIAYLEGQPTDIKSFELVGVDYGLRGAAVIEGLATGLRTQLNAALSATDLSRFSAIAGRELDGQTALALEGALVPLSGQFDVTAQGRATELALGIARVDAVLRGVTQLRFAAKRDETGTTLRDLVLSNPALELTGQANLRSQDSRVQARFLLKDLGIVVPQYSGPVLVTATADQDARGWSIDAATAGPYQATVTASGLATGPNASLIFSAAVPDLRPFAPQLEGPFSAKGKLRQSPDGWHIDTQAKGPHGAEATLNGILGPDLALGFDMSLPNLRPLVPGVNGPLQATGRVMQTARGIVIDAKGAGPYSVQAAVQGVVTGPDAAVEYKLDMPNIGAIVTQVNGPLSIEGTARKEGPDWKVKTDARGPSGTQAQLAGVVTAGGNLDLGVIGTAPLGLSRPFLAPRDLQGTVGFDLRINGPAALSSVSGKIQTSNASFSAPNLRLALQGIAADIGLSNSRAQINVTGTGSNGGQLRAAGTVGLTSGLVSDIKIGLSNLVLIDPRLYRTSVNGALSVTGPLAGGASIAGQINVGETTVTVPATGVTSIGDIPPITHIGAGPSVRQTLREAGLDTAATAADPAAAGRGAGIGLNLNITAANRIFVRGRGLDAELGGGLRLTGTSNEIISAGRFSLLRGRLDILGKRFDLREGSAQFQGDLVPFIRFVSATSIPTGEVRVIVEGPADAPEVTFESTPEAPQDEVLAQLLFGRNIAEISAFQALQLANGVATLAGRGGLGIISNLRNGFGLDDLDVTTTDSGATAVRAGKYISENVYSDVTAASDGTGEVSLNLDITSNLKGKATLGSDGNSGIGIFFEKDY